METYQQLLNQFHENEQAENDCPSQTQYKQLLCELFIKKKNKQEKIHKYSLGVERLREKHHSPVNLPYQTLKSSKISLIFPANEASQQKRNLIELQRDTMLHEIEELKDGILKIKQNKSQIQSQIQLLNRNQIQTQNALIDSLKNCQELRYLIKEQNTKKQQEWRLYDIKIQQLASKLTTLNEDNVKKSVDYTIINRNKVKSRNDNILGSILSFQSEKNHKIEKKIYTKNQIQSMLRSLYFIVKLSELSYGNIIEHLILISEDDRSNQQVQFEEHNQNGNSRTISKQINNDKKKIKIRRNRNTEQIYINDRGEQIPISQVIKILQRDLISAEQMKFLSKTMMIAFFEQKGLIIETYPENGHFTPAAQKLISIVVQHYVKITSWFARIQKRNIQLSEYYNDLLKVDDDLQIQINSIQSSVAQKHIQNLKQRQNQIDFLSQKVNQMCKIIFKFNINTYDLIRRFKRLNQLFDKIVKSTKRKTSKKPYYELQTDNSFFKSFSKILFRSPENIILDWNNAMKNCKKDKLSSCQTLQKLPDNQIFLEKIMKNDILRIYSVPHIYQFQKSYLYNIEKTFNYVIHEQKGMIKSLSVILKNLLLFSKKGIQVYTSEGKYTQQKQNLSRHKSIQKKMGLIDFLNFGQKNQYNKNEDSRVNQVNTRIQQSQTQQQQNNEAFNPLMLILKNNQMKIDKFFTKDEVKEDKHSTSYSNNLCVESKDYFRRDNFKIIQKLERIQLKKKGLFENLPFSVNTSLELQPLNNTLSTSVVQKPLSSRLNSVNLNSFRLRCPRFTQQLLESRHNQLSQRREKESLRRKDLRELLKNISNIATENHKYRIKKKLLSKDKRQIFSVSNSRHHIRD